MASGITPLLARTDKGMTIICAKTNPGRKTRLKIKPRKNPRRFPEEENNTTNTLKKTRFSRGRRPKEKLLKSRKNPGRFPEDPGRSPWPKKEVGRRDGKGGQTSHRKCVENQSRKKNTLKKTNPGRTPEEPPNRIISIPFQVLNKLRTPYIYIERESYYEL